MRNLQDEAVAIYDLCVRHFIRPKVKRISRKVNLETDYLSKSICKGDFWLAANVFAVLNQLWGPHSVDWFLSHKSAQVQSFFAQFWCPGTEGGDAFTGTWEKVNCSIFPLPRSWTTCAPAATKVSVHTFL